MSWRRPLPIMVLVGALAACSPDYTAVRAWSVQARQAFLPPAAARAPAVATQTAGRAEAIIAMQDAAAVWLATVAQLAADGLPQDRANPFLQFTSRVRPFDEAAASAIESLGETIVYAALHNWRAPQLASAVERGEPAFQELMAALSRQVEAFAAEAPDDRDAFEARVTAALASRTSPAARLALEEVQAMRWEELARRARAEEAWRAAVARVAAGHSLLNGRRRHLSQAETARLVREQEIELARLVVLSRAR